MFTHVASVYFINMSAIYVLNEVFEYVLLYFVIIFAPKRSEILKRNVKFE